EWLVRRSDGPYGVLRLRPDELSRAAAFLRDLRGAEVVRARDLGAAAAGGAGQCRGGVADAALRAIRGTGHCPVGCGRDGGFTGWGVLRSLFDPRIVAAFLPAADRV